MECKIICVFFKKHTHKMLYVYVWSMCWKDTSDARYWVSMGWGWELGGEQGKVRKKLISPQLDDYVPLASDYD